MTPSKGYQWPTPIDPEAEVCIKVYVPADQLYIAAFLRSYQFFGSWLAWERDAAKTGKDVAEVWKRSIDRTLSAVAYGEACCSEGDMDIRQKPGVPCVIQKLVDEEWVDTVDMRLCVPRMRIVGGVVQQDTTGNGDWVDAGDPDDPYDPRTDAPAPAPWEEPPPGETGQCLSAANVAAYINFVASEFADCMVDGLTFFQTLGVATTILTALLDLIPLTVLTAAITSLYQTVIDEWVDVRDFDITSALTDMMVCKYNADGSMTESQFNALIEEVEEWEATLSDIDQRAKVGIAVRLMQLWGPVGMTISGQIWGITTYDCDYSGCVWEHTFDFTIDEQGWSVDVVDNNQGGVYLPGQGWRHYDLTQGDSYRMVGVGIEFDSVNLTEIAMRFDWHTGDFQFPTNAAYIASPMNNFLLVEGPGALAEGENVLTYSFPTPTSCDFVREIIRSSQNSDPIFSGSILLTSITFKGTGVNPFE